MVAKKGSVPSLPKLCRIDNDCYDILEASASAACCAAVKNNVKNHITELLEGPDTLNEFKTLYGNIIRLAVQIGGKLRATELLDDNNIDTLNYNP